MSPTLLLLVGGLMVFAAATLALSLVGVVSVERRGVARSLAAIEALNAAPESLRSELDRRTMPWTRYPFSRRSSARYEPSWPVMPVMSAVFNASLLSRLRRRSR